jgi:hypothetical protein
LVQRDYPPARVLDLIRDAAAIAERDKLEVKAFGVGMPGEFNE